MLGILHAESIELGIAGLGGVLQGSGYWASPVLCAQEELGSQGSVRSLFATHSMTGVGDVGTLVADTTGEG